MTEIKKEYYTNGNIRTITTYLNNLRHGRKISFYQNGNIMYEASYSNDRLNGTTIFYYENGELNFKMIYKDGKYIKTKKSFMSLLKDFISKIRNKKWKII